MACAPPVDDVDSFSKRQIRDERPRPNESLIGQSAIGCFLRMALNLRIVPKLLDIRRRTPVIGSSLATGWLPSVT